MISGTILIMDSATQTKRIHREIHRWSYFLKLAMRDKWKDWTEDHVVSITLKCPYACTLLGILDVNTRIWDSSSFEGCSCIGIFDRPSPLWCCTMAESCTCLSASWMPCAHCPYIFCSGDQESHRNWSRILDRALRTPRMQKWINLYSQSPY